MGFYNKINDFYRLVGNNVASKTNETIDDFLSSLTDKYSNAGLILNYIKNSGVSGNTTIKTVLSNSQYFNILNQALRLANITDTTDFYQKVLDDYSQYTQQNKVVLGENDLTFFGGYTGNTFSYTNLVEFGESLVAEDVTVFSGDVVGKSYKLKGLITLGEVNTDIYVLPLGLISLVGDYDILSFGNNKNGVSAFDSLYQNVSTPLAPGCAVTDIGSGIVTAANVAFVIADNSLITQDDYLLVLIIATLGTNIGSTTINLDQEILIANADPNLRVEFINI